MRDHPYSSAAGRLFIGCRYAVYGCLALLSGVAHHDRIDVLMSVCAAFAVLACVMHGICRWQRAAAWLRASHLVETAMALTVLTYVGSPLELQMLAASVFVSANTALWGLPGLIVHGLVCLSLVALWPWSAAATETVRHLSVAAALVFSLGLSMAAHHQAELLSRRGRAWRDESRTLRRFLPENLPRQLQGMTVHRSWYCVGFVDLNGFTRASHTLDDDALCTFLNDFLSSVNALVHAWDGQVTKFLGDGVLCVFPADSPDVRRNSALQAVRCLRHIPVILSQLERETGPGPGYAATIGIASGDCLAGEWGGAGRFDYTVIGAPVNRAQRLQARAGRYGGLLMDAATAALIDHGEDPGKRLTLRLKGIGVVTAYALDDSTSSPDKTSVNVRVRSAKVRPIF